MLAIATWQHGASYAATESRSMIVGAVALGVYTWRVCQLLVRLNWSALAATVYNRTRLHSAIGYIAAIEMELKAA